MGDDVSPELLQRIHDLSSELAQLKLSYVQDFSNFLRKLETVEAAHQNCKSLLEQMKCQLASHCENERNLVHQLRHSDDCAVFVNYYDVTEKIQRAGSGEKLLSLGVSERFRIQSHEFKIYAEIGRRSGSNHKVRLYFKEYRPTTSFKGITWPFKTMIEVNACQLTRNLLLESHSPPGEDGDFVMAADIMCLNTLSREKSVIENDYFSVSIKVKSR